MRVTRYQTPMDSGGETFGRGPSRKVFAMQSGSGILHGTRAPPSGLATQPFWVDASMGVSFNGGTPQIIHFDRCSTINHPFWGTTSLGNTQMERWADRKMQC